MPPPNQTIFSDAEIEKMRLFVNEHDKQKSVNEFDLNNPPRVNYVHQPWPKLVYNVDRDGKRIHKKVNDADEHDAALAAGWTNEPQAEAELDESPLDAASAKEVETIDKSLAALRKKTRK